MCAVYYYYTRKSLIWYFESYCDGYSSIVKSLISLEDFCEIIEL